MIIFGKCWRRAFRVEAKAAEGVQEGGEFGAKERGGEGSVKA